MFKQVILTSTLCIPLSALASEDLETITKPKGISVGIGAVGTTGLYVGEETNFTPVPVFAYEGERFFLRGLYGGVNLYKHELFNVNAILAANMNKLDVDKLKASKLAKHNLTKSQLEDRDISADLGVELLLKPAFGNISIIALGDIGGASDAATIKVNYQYFWRLNEQLILIPNIGLEWMSEDRANYYYGTFNSEVARGVERYKPGQVTIPHISLGANYNFNENWRAVGAVSYDFLPNKVKDSTIVDADNAANFYVGLTYKF